MKLGPYTFTRDSWLWFWSKLVAGAGVLAAGVFDLKAIGLNDHQQHLVMAVSTAILALSAHYGSSPLPARKDVQP